MSKSKISNDRRTLGLLLALLLAFQVSADSYVLDVEELNSHILKERFSLVDADYIHSLPEEALLPLLDELDFEVLAKGRNHVIFQFVIIKIRQLEAKGVGYERDAAVERLTLYVRACLDSGAPTPMSFGRRGIADLSRFDHPAILTLLEDYVDSEDSYIKREAEEGLSRYEQRRSQARRETGKGARDSASRDRRLRGRDGASGEKRLESPEGEGRGGPYIWALVLGLAAILVAAGIWIRGRRGSSQGDGQS